MGPADKDIPIVCDSDVSSARQAGAQLAEHAGLNMTQKHCLITSISELAANILNHAVRGRITMRIVAGSDGNRGVEVVASDQGPGIVDTELAMQDGYSTTGSLGGGLPGVNRMMSEMELSSAPGNGTRVRAVKWMNEPSTANHALPPSGLETAEPDPFVSDHPPSAHEDGLAKDRRRFRRFDVAWSGRCESDKGSVIGLIKNVSEQGAFFEPAVDADDEESIRPGEASALFVKGSSWTLRLGPGRGFAPLVVKATVRWVGQLHTLASEGIGFEFEVRLPGVAGLVPGQSHGVSPKPGLGRGPAR